MLTSLLLVSEFDFWCRTRALYCSQLSQLFIYLILLTRKDCPSKPHGTRKTIDFAPSPHDFAPASWYPRATTLYSRPMTWYPPPTTLHPRPTTISYPPSEHNVISISVQQVHFASHSVGERMSWDKIWRSKGIKVFLLRCRCH